MIFRSLKIHVSSIYRIYTTHMYIHVCMYVYIQVTFEQHRFELHRPTYTWIFFGIYRFCIMESINCRSKTVFSNSQLQFPNQGLKILFSLQSGDAKGWLWSQKSYLNFWLGRTGTPTSMLSRVNCNAILSNKRMMTI